MTSRWSWPESDASGASRVWSDLDERGSSWFRCPEAAETSVDPTDLVERLLGRRPVRVAFNSITPWRPASLDHIQRRSYPHTSGDARLHVDPDPDGVLTPHVQIMVCRRPADQGGASLILDVWPLLAKIRAEEPELYEQLFEVPRRLQFSGRDAFGPTIADRQGNLVCFMGAVPPKDRIGCAFRKWIDGARPTEFRAEGGDVYINSNHRTLHGRRAFVDRSREFLRILAWFREPLAAPDSLLDRARAESRALSSKIADEPLWMRQAFGFDLPERDPLEVIDQEAARRRGRPEVWRAAVPPGMPREEVDARLDDLLHRLQGAAEQPLERVEGG